MRVLETRRAIAVILAIAGLVIGAVVSIGVASLHRPPAPLHVSIAPAQILADGHETTTLTIEADTAERPQISSDSQHRVLLQSMRRTNTGWEARFRAGTLPGHVQLRVHVSGYRPAAAQLDTLLDASDALEDGTPDFLRLDSANDAEAFRRWFTFLAEAQYFQSAEMRPPEITDCAALIRYAYREALRRHDTAWAMQSHLPLAPALESVAKYDYPHTAAGPALFRTRAGSFRASDLEDGTFAQFADAKTLFRFNCHFRTRDVARAEPGDILFYRQDSDHMPYHSMIYLGPSQINRGASRYVLYHTGPSGSEPGEIRRLTLDQLMHFPQPEWRPFAGNPAFLGVYRWNILEKEL